jgi:hypothetical protein
MVLPTAPNFSRFFLIFLTPLMLLVEVIIKIKESVWFALPTYWH